VKESSANGDRQRRLDGVARQLRLIELLDAAENAGIAPLTVSQLHTFAYFANALASTWDMPAHEGKVLKRRDGPFYPMLQKDLDRLVGMGVVVISNLGYSLDKSRRWRLDGDYRLDRQFADRILRRARQFEDESLSIAFIQELAFALSALNSDELDNAKTEDATYANPHVGFGNVVDFAEWSRLNYTANAADELGRLLPGTIQSTLGEKLHFYIRHLYTRLHGGR
jgi:hypothetical protein